MKNCRFVVFDISGDDPEKYQLTSFDCGIRVENIYLRFLYQMIYEIIPIVCSESYIVYTYCKITNFLKKHRHSSTQVKQILGNDFLKKLKIGFMKFYPIVLIIIWFPILSIVVIRDLSEMEIPDWVIFCGRMLVGLQVSQNFIDKKRVLQRL